ncbi:hypothetical protein [Dyadobacter sp. CY347]|uniref:hypothetical protein n=1 Tax=Dyadobacter sp. CY347 TaxID=2909336 RepID=UPI001F33C238|nr:hypothetical protein [Dyadobacter sp. CY347]MCF2489906.1 hypothetical protein [Dyadobacter sp. CY347]
MATQTTQKQKVRQRKAVEFLIGNKEFIFPIKPVVFSSARPIVFASEYTDAKVASQKSYVKPFVMPDSFLKQAEDMANFLDKNPLPQRD